MDGALAEMPCALREVRLLHELDDPPVTLGPPDLILVVGALGRQLASAHAVLQEEVHRLGIAQ